MLFLFAIFENWDDQLVRKSEMFKDFREFGHKELHNGTNHGWEVLESLGSQEAISRETDHSLNPLLMSA